MRLQNGATPASIILAGLTGISVMSPARAQSVLGTMPNKAKMAECVQEITVDSVLLFYDLRYNLTPTACADIRRHVRLTSKGDFRGEARDYSLATGRLRTRLHYDQGQRDGLFATYYPNGQMAMQGNYTHGEPTGTWEFWYPNGQRQQLFAWTGQAAPRLRILAAWDSTGQASVTDGTGVWQGIMPHLKRRYGGPVQDGLPQGDWESHAFETNKLLVREIYEKGVFRGGKAFDVPASMASRYKTRSLLEPEIADPTESGDEIRLGLNCAAIGAQRMQVAELSQAARALRTMRLEPPRPPVDAITYAHQLLDRLYQTNQRNQWENMIDGQEFTIRATVDEEGTLRLISGQGGSGIITAVSQALDGMARWHPATADGSLTSGDVQFLIVKTGAQLSIRWKTMARPPQKTPLPVR